MLFHEPYFDVHPSHSPGATLCIHLQILQIASPPSPIPPTPRPIRAFFALCPVQYRYFTSHWTDRCNTTPSVHVCTSYVHGRPVISPAHQLKPHTLLCVVARFLRSATPVFFFSFFTVCMFVWVGSSELGPYSDGLLSKTMSRSCSGCC